ncbi:MAG: hypothetical protein H6797_01875 [Candidatus Nomurabacteria bacterium]|nr:MAG: hypothetical protein H6797_01875 [Candidatus Nomurabacteria bacterium]
MSDTEKFICSLIVTQAPMLQDVIDSKKWGVITLSVATFSASLDDDLSVVPTCKLSELQLRNIRNIQLDDNDQQFSFEGDYRFSYEHNSHSQSYVRTETTSYRVIVRWSSRFEQDLTAYLLQLD